MKIAKLTPNFEVNDIRETVQFYESALGFSLVMAVPETQDGVHETLTDGLEYVYALMKNGEVELMFQRSDSFKHDVELASCDSTGASVSFYMEVVGLEELYAQLKDQVSEITEVKTTWYGMKEFYLKDVNGYILAFAEQSN